jgi:endogenous inhibitor of DNA gyrase (YacG/DUF329 family)
MAIECPKCKKESEEIDWYQAEWVLNGRQVKSVCPKCGEAL